MKKYLLAALLTAATMSSAALAADPPYDPPVVADPAYDWTGFYVGVHGGYSGGTVRIDDTFCWLVEPANAVCLPNNPANRYFAEPSLAGWRVGLHAGAQQQIDMFVLGVEGDVSWNNARGSANFRFFDGAANVLNPPDLDQMTTFSMLWDGSVRAKAGFVMDRFMPYLTAGVAFGQAQIHDDRQFGPGPAGVRDFDHNVNLIGATAGAGVNYALTDNIILRGEARLTQFGIIDSNAPNQGNVEFLRITGPSLVNVEAGISFKF